MITYTTSTTPSDLNGILHLQKINLPAALTHEDIQNQGFVTVNHTPEQLKKLNDIEQHIIAKDGDSVIAYLLSMTQQSKADIPVLIPMFDVFDKIIYNGKTVSNYHYIVVGQACVDKNYRGQGIFDNCYTEYRHQLQHKYDFAITEIAASNLRSINAHKRIGFKEIHSYHSPDGVEWSVVLWDWHRPEHF
jgi:hypothetical protein